MKIWIKRLLIIGAVGAIIGLGIVIYLFNMPHRDVVGEEASIKVAATELVANFLDNEATANQKYLDNVVEISGTVQSVRTDSQGQAVVMLKEAGQKAAISCTFTPETSKDVEAITEGSNITIKGIVRAGAAYDADMDLYEHVVAEKCSVVNH
jgi:hypothetical protein